MTYLYNNNVSATGNVYLNNNSSLVSTSNPLPVSLGGANIIIIGNTNIVDTVTVNSTPDDPVHIHITEVGTSGNLIALGYNYLPVGGNIGITSMPAVEISNDFGNALPVTYADSIQMDSTDRLRTSVVGQQWWYVPSVDKDGDLRIQEKIQGTGASSTFIQNLASVRLTSGQFYSSNTQLTGSAIRASRRRHKTRPGISIEWVGIINWDGLQANVIKRVGMFTNYNGVFFEANATTVSAVVRRRLTDGTLVETKVPHTQWNKDTMDGKGPTGYDWRLANTTVTANISSVIGTANVAISGDGNVYVVTYQVAAGEIDRLTVGKKFTVSGLNPAGFNDTGLVTSVNNVTNRANIAYVEYTGTYTSANANAKMVNTPLHAVHSYFCDYSGSRIARIRFGMLTDNGKQIVHEMKLGELGTQFMSAPALMDRKEIVNIAQPVDFLPSLTIAGSAVNIETTAEINPGFGAAWTPTSITFNKTTDVNKEYAVLGVGIRPGEPYQRADLQLNQFQVVDLGNLNPQNAGVFQWRLILNPTTSQSGTYTDVGKATHQITYPEGTTITGGITLLTGYNQGTFTGDVRTALNFLNMGSNIDYTDSDVIILAVKLLVGGSSSSLIQAGINYTEDL